MPKILCRFMQVFGLSALFLLVACGQTGALYLPTDDEKPTPKAEKIEKPEEVDTDVDTDKAATVPVSAE